MLLRKETIAGFVSAQFLLRLTNCVNGIFLSREIFQVKSEEFEDCNQSNLNLEQTEIYFFEISVLFSSSPRIFRIVSSVQRCKKWSNASWPHSFLALYLVQYNLQKSSQLGSADKEACFSDVSSCHELSVFLNGNQTGAVCGGGPLRRDSKGLDNQWKKFLSL